MILSRHRHADQESTKHRDQRLRRSDGSWASNRCRALHRFLHPWGCCHRSMESNRWAVARAAVLRERARRRTGWGAIFHAGDGDGQAWLRAMKGALGRHTLKRAALKLRALSFFKSPSSAPVASARVAPHSKADSPRATIKSGDADALDNNGLQKRKTTHTDWESGQEVQNLVDGVFEDKQSVAIRRSLRMLPEVVAMVERIWNACDPERGRICLKTYMDFHLSCYHYIADKEGEAVDHIDAWDNAVADWMGDTEEALQLVQKRELHFELFRSSVFELIGKSHSGTPFVASLNARTFSRRSASLLLSLSFSLVCAHPCPATLTSASHLSPTPCTAASDLYTPTLDSKQYVSYLRLLSRAVTKEVDGKPQLRHTWRPRPRDKRLASALLSVLRHEWDALTDDGAREESARQTFHRWLQHQDARGEMEVEEDDRIHAFDEADEASGSKDAAKKAAPATVLTLRGFLEACESMPQLSLPSPETGEGASRICDAFRRLDASASGVLSEQDFVNVLVHGQPSGWLPEKPKASLAMAGRKLTALSKMGGLHATHASPLGIISATPTTAESTESTAETGRSASTIKKGPAPINKLGKAGKLLMIATAVTSK